MLIENQAAMETKGVLSFGNAVGRTQGEVRERGGRAAADEAFHQPPWLAVGQSLSDACGC